jgi:hypothetical protein
VSRWTAVGLEVELEVGLEVGLDVGLDAQLDRPTSTDVLTMTSRTKHLISADTDALPKLTSTMRVVGLLDRPALEWSSISDCSRHDTTALAEQKDAKYNAWKLQLPPLVDSTVILRSTIALDRHRRVALRRKDTS